MASGGDTVATVLDKIRKKYPDREAYISYNVDLVRTSVTFKELWTLARRFANVLKQEGLVRNDLVVLVVPISLEYVIACLGVILAGGRVCSILKVMKEGTLLLQTVTMSNAKFVIVGCHEDNSVWTYLAPHSHINERKPHIASISTPVLPTLTTAILCYRSFENGETPLMELLRGSEAEYTDTELTPSDGAVVIVALHTGAIALPKMCEMSHGAIVSKSKAWAKAFPDVKKMCVPHPWYLVGGLPYDTLNGCIRVIPDHWSPLWNMHKYELNMKILEAESVKAVFYTPDEIAFIVEKRKDLQKKYVDIIMTGGMPMTKYICQSARQIAEKTYILYLSCEAALISVNAIRRTDDCVAFDVGLPMEDTQIRILRDSLLDVPPGQMGQVAIKSKSLFTKYVGEPEKTEKSFIQGGWYLTGDAGFVRSDGHLSVYGRTGDVICRGIINTIPAWLEKPISAHPDVMQVIVVPVPNSINRQNTCACVVKRPGSKLTAENIMSLVTRTLTRDGNMIFVIDYVLFFDDLPKISRVRLGQVAAERLGLREF